MDEWFKVALPYIAPLVLAAVAASLGVIFSGRARLRRDLNADATIVGQLIENSSAREALSRDMERRTTRLVILSRLPVLRGAELLRLAGVLLVAGVVSWTAYGTATDDDWYPDVVIGSFGLASINAVVWFELHRTWWLRSDLRISIQDSLGVRWDDSLFVRQTVALATLALGGLVVVGPPIGLTYGVLVQLDVSSERRALLIPIGVAVFMAALFFQASRGNRSSDDVRQALDTHGLTDLVFSTVVGANEPPAGTVDPLASSRTRRALRWLAYAGRGGVPTP